jgi:hypothetical protein
VAHGQAAPVLIEVRLPSIDSAALGALPGREQNEVGAPH